MPPVALPIDPLLPEIVATLRRSPSLVLEAPPGAGKTTRVPRALLEAGIGGGQEIIVLQPRRLATRLAAKRVAEELGFEVTLEYLESADDRHLEQQVLAGLKRLFAGGSKGDVLVFLPGAGEIRRARQECEDFAQRHRVEIHALHGDLPSAEQDRAVRPSSRRKIILSTNMWETSVTTSAAGPRCSGRCGRRAVGGEPVEAGLGAELGRGDVGRAVGVRVAVRADVARARGQLEGRGVAVDSLEGDEPILGQAFDELK